jgi:DNA-directed RNA polymerase specialized sigma24 family protein
VNDAVVRAVENIADGMPVDWQVVERSIRPDGTTTWVKDLHIIQEVANFYRLSACEPALPAKPSVAASTVEEPTVEVVVGQEHAARYQAGLRHLPRADRHAVIGRLELLSSYSELGAVLGYHYRGTRAAASAARRAVTRALRRLAIEMGHV